ncbi:MAG: ABC transporter permease, partial [Acidobacteria bacterium]|nr:ABC transporter permease [Acidobacteriota bacterium]
MIKQIMKKKSSKFASLFILAMIVVSYFAPLIANNKPIFMIYNEKVSFSAFRDLFPFNKFLKADEISLKLQINPYFVEQGKKDGSVKKCMMPLCPYSPLETSIDDISAPPDFKKRHFFGCDDNGRDIFSRLVHGSKNSLLVGFVAVFIAGILGIIIGGIGGYCGGIVDQIIISRLIEVMLSFPSFFLIITIAAVMEPKYLNIWTLMIIIGLTSWTGIARYTRGEFLKLKESDFVNASKVMGASAPFIILRHLIP